MKDLNKTTRSNQQREIYVDAAAAKISTGRRQLAQIDEKAFLIPLLYYKCSKGAISTTKYPRARGEIMLIKQSCTLKV
jgi:hypothetical protein